MPEAADDGGSEIMFDASGNSIIDSIDGIAEGMSGSPLYVEEPNTGTEELLEAVAYGWEFTDSGLGLATPIEHMMTLESQVSAGSLTAGPVVALERPLSVAGRTITGVVVAPTAVAARDAEGRQPHCRHEAAQHAHRDRPSGRLAPLFNADQDACGQGHSGRGRPR